MKRLALTIILVLTIVNIASAGGTMDGWRFNIMGVDPFDLKGRSAVQIMAGVAASMIVHEAGHYAIGRLEGHSPRIDGTNVLIDANPSQAFLGAGFAAQLAVGGLLTIVNKGSDFSYGFNATTAGQAAMYGITRGTGEYSDVKQLDNGDAIAWGTAGVAAGLTALNRREGR